MSPNPMNLILQRLDNEPPLFFAEEVEEYLAKDLDQLVALGLLQETTPSRTAVCGECERGTIGFVQFVTNTRTGRPHAYLPCMECGAVEVPMRRLKRWLVPIAGLLEALSRVAGIRGPLVEIVPNHLWRVGRATWGPRAREVYFARNVHEENRDAVAPEMARRPKAILFFPTEEGVRCWRGPAPNLVLALESVLALGPDGLAFDHPLVEEVLSDSPDVGQVKPKPKRFKRGERAAKIESLKKELIQHLLAARDHAKETGGLLPRPTQKELAKLTGLTESDVSRCLADPQARELVLLWETANDLERILTWSGQVRSRKGE